MFYQFGLWFDANYEKIWLIVMIVSIALVVLGTIGQNDIIYDVGDTITDFYDECLSE